MTKKRFMGIHRLIWQTTFAKAGAEWIHMVDLDGAKEGKRVNDEYVVRSGKRA